MSWREPPQHSASPRAAGDAKILRRSMTGPERRLWRHFRDRLPVDGTHVRRQLALDRYVVDFCCLSTRLVIEVDGDHHGHNHQSTSDAARTAVLMGLGCRVLRVTNTDVTPRIDGVLETIPTALATIPSPTHGPAARGA